MDSPLGQPVATSPRDDSEPGTARLPYRLDFPREFAFAARPTGNHCSEGFLSTAPPGFPTGKTFPREFAFLARPPGCHFSEGFEPDSPTGKNVPRESGFTAWLTGRPFRRDFEPGSARLPDRFHFSEGI